MQHLAHRLRIKMKLFYFFRSQDENVRSHRRQFLVAFIVTLCIFTTGMHVGWPTPSLPKLFSDEFPFEVTNAEASNILALGYAGDVTGGILSCYFFDTIGRKKTIMLFSLPQFLSFACIYFSWYAKVLLYVARVLGGIAEAALFSLCALYIAETVQPAIRGRYGSMAPLFLQVSLLLSNVVGTYLTLYNAALIYMVLPLVFLAVFAKMPETPYYLLMKGKTAEAENSLKFLLDKDKVEKELGILKQDVERQMTESGTFKDLICIRSNRKALFLTISLRVVQQYSGCTPIANYGQILMKNSVSFLSPLAASSLMLMVQLLMVIFAVILVDRYGRKPLLIFSTVGCFLANTCTGVYYTVRDYTGLDTTPYEFVPLIFIMTYLVLFSSGLQPLVNLMNSEMFSQSVKGKAYLVLNVCFSLLAPSCLKYYQMMADGVGVAVPFYTFGIDCIIGTIIFALWLPETKGKRLEEIQQELKGNKDCDKNGVSDHC